MYIQSLELADFRNFEKLQVTFSEGTNIFYGDNAQGKTNILESLYMTATTKSHRGMKDRDMIRFEKEEAHIRSVVFKNDIDYRIDMHLRKSRSKGIAINGQRIKKAAELIGLLNIVFFSPEDLAIVKNGPSQRRRFMDMELCQLDASYMHDLNQYTKIVEQRNRILKDIYDHPEFMPMLDVWDEQLADHGIRIIQRRQAYIRELNDILSSVHEKLSGGRESMYLGYEPNTDAEKMKEAVREARRTDRHLKMTTVGPHRDDFSFIGRYPGREEEIDLRRFGSQGQQRTCALSLKLSEIEIVKKKTGENPILMLDDVLSELDSGRQEYLLDTIGGLQTFITCTGLDEFVNSRLKIDRVYRVKNGSIEDNL